MLALAALHGPSCLLKRRRWFYKEGAPHIHRGFGAHHFSQHPRAHSHTHAANTCAHTRTGTQILTHRLARSCWAEARIKIARVTLTIKLDRNWSSFQLANNTPPLSVTGSVIAPSARMRNHGARGGCTLYLPAWRLRCNVLWRACEASLPPLLLLRTHNVIGHRAANPRQRCSEKKYTT